MYGWGFYFEQKLQSYMLSTTLMAENLKACQEEKTKLNNTVSNLNSGMYVRTIMYVAFCKGKGCLIYKWIS